MSKFGQLIDEKIPLLLVFYDLNSIEDNFMDLSPILKDVAAALGDKGKVIKIDINKNNEISQALRIRVLPTLIIYKNGEMVWRQSGQQDANTLIGLMNENLN
ncbi:MAG: thioredoxin domain-containing protein [Bacteroidota bacterium]|nr:thiol reductase thioredoxin [Flavobacteriaceae bacterium]MEC8615200.1 thioredoxin domain-containing protein [Bacteroidota bacterium]